MLERALQASARGCAVINLVLAGTDPVALDALGTGFFGMNLADIGYIAKVLTGPGEIDFTK